MSGWVPKERIPSLLLWRSFFSWEALLLFFTFQITLKIYRLNKWGILTESIQGQKLKTRFFIVSQEFMWKFYVFLYSKAHKAFWFSFNTTTVPDFCHFLCLCITKASKPKEIFCISFMKYHYSVLCMHAYVCVASYLISKG